MASNSSSSNASSKKPSPPSYISSEGHMLGNQPLASRINRTVDDIYNFFGLYFVSLFSLDPYGAAQNSTFNTRSRGPNHYQNTARWGATGARQQQPPRAGPSGGGSTGRGSGGGGGSSGSGGSGGGGRRMGTVDDVRGPECGSCG